MPNPGHPIGQKNIIVKATPVITANSAYSSGQCVGAPIQFSNVVVPGARSGVIGAAALVDGDKQDTTTELWLFSDQPAGTYTNKTSFDPTVADLDGLLVGIINFAASDYGDGANHSTCFEGNLSIPFWTGDDAKTSLWGVLVTRGTPTYTATNNVRVHLHVTQD